jgi:AraC family carnitine catabolism transcriptional activator
MVTAPHKVTSFIILATPHCNLAATSAFLDPFRVANYLVGANQFHWQIVSLEGGAIQTSNGMALVTEPLAAVAEIPPDFVVVSSSWTPEHHHSPDISKALLRWAKRGAKIGALDTGGFILAKAGLLNGKRATVHYEHIDAFHELYPDVEVTESLFEIDDDVFTCCGGLAAADLAINILRDTFGTGPANAVARYIFHHNVRGAEATQNPDQLEPIGHTMPGLVRRAIDVMEAHLEEPLSIPEIAAQLSVSQRHLARLFQNYVHKTPVLYYRDIRLDRARGLVTQTEMKLSEVAVASGFSSQVHFSRAYHARFGLSPKKDRIEGRVPFAFRAWPMHSPGGG